jgi:hypothetical protein
VSITKDIMTTKIILTTSADWEEWNKRFMSQVIMYDLLRHIQGDENLLSKPIRPATADYPQKARSTTARSRTQTHAEASGQGTSEGQTMSPEPDRQEVTFSDLTADGQKSFSMAWTFYQDDTKAYEKQQDLIRKLKEWIAANVSSHYQETCCEPTESMAEWYKNLKMAAGIDTRSEENNAREKYKEALKTPEVKDLTMWVDLWEKTMTVAKKKKVVETTKTSIWFQDFLAAIRGALPMWAAAYGISKDPQVEDGTLDYRKVANDLRREAGQYTEAKSPSKFDKGSFGPAFAGEEDQQPGGDVQETPDRGDVQETSDKDFEDATERTRDRRTKGKQKYKTASQKRKNAPDEISGRVCRGCEGFHPTKHCYYLFPKKAPEEWIPRPHIQEIVEQNLKDDSTLEEEVKRWTKSKRE